MYNNGYNTQQPYSSWGQQAGGGWAQPSQASSQGHWSAYGNQQQQHQQTAYSYDSYSHQQPLQQHSWSSFEGGWGLPQRGNAHSTAGHPLGPFAPSQPAAAAHNSQSSGNGWRRNGGAWAAAEASHGGDGGGWEVVSRPHAPFQQPQPPANSNTSYSNSWHNQRQPQLVAPGTYQLHHAPPPSQSLDPRWRSNTRFSTLNAPDTPPKFPSPPPGPPPEQLSAKELESHQKNHAEAKRVTAGNPPPAPAQHSPRRRNRNQQQHLVPYHTNPSAPSSGFRRQKIARQGPPPEPSEEYLALVNGHSTGSIPIADRAPLLVLDLNNTLLVRRNKNHSSALTPLARPFLASFLAYVTGRDQHSGERRWKVAVYSSARSHNVLGMLQALELVPLNANAQLERRAAQIDSKQKKWRKEKMIVPDRDEDGESDATSDAGASEEELMALEREKGRWHTSPGDPLCLVWSREWMGLSQAEFDLNVQTTKDLTSVWRELGTDDPAAGGEEGEGVRRSVLLDDEPTKAALQPHNHLPISSFLCDPARFPQDPNSYSSRSPSPLPVPLPTEPKGRVNMPLQLNNSAPEAADEALLSTIYFLSVLAKEPNMAQFIKDGGIDRLRDEVGGEDGAVECGRQELERAGIPVEREWRSGWFKQE